MTLKEARLLQKEKSTKAILLFAGSVALAAVGGCLLFSLTDILESSSVFYLIPLIILGLGIKLSKIYLFFSPKEFRGKVVSLRVYTAKSPRVKGEFSYIQREHLEVEIIIDNGSKSILRTLPVGDITMRIGEGTELCYLRFIEEPIIIEEKK